MSNTLGLGMLGLFSMLAVWGAITLEVQEKKNELAQQERIAKW